MNDFMRDNEGRPLIELGETYQDKVLGIKGVATAQARYLTGCDQVCLERWDAENNKIHAFWLDATRLEGIDASAKTNPGGPQPTPPSRYEAR